MDGEADEGKSDEGKGDGDSDSDGDDKQDNVRGNQTCGLAMAGIMMAP